MDDQTPETRLLNVGGMARRLGVKPAWLRAEAEAGGCEVGSIEPGKPKRKGEPARSPHLRRRPRDQD
ncbi:MAG: hypothetical protein ACOC9P_01820 [bacterium]